MGSDRDDVSSNSCSTKSGQCSIANQSLYEKNKASLWAIPNQPLDISPIVSLLKWKSRLRGEGGSSASVSTKSSALRERKKYVGTSLDYKEVTKTLRGTRPLGQTIDLLVETVNQPLKEARCF